MRNRAALAVLLFGSILLFGFSYLCFVGAGEFYQLELQATDPQEKHILSSRAVTTFMWAGIALVFSTVFFILFVYDLCRPETEKDSTKKTDGSKEHKE